MGIVYIQCVSIFTHKEFHTRHTAVYTLFEHMYTPSHPSLYSQVHIVLRLVKSNAEFKHHHHSHADSHRHNQLDYLLCTIPQGRLEIKDRTHHSDTTEK